MLLKANSEQAQHGPKHSPTKAAAAKKGTSTPPTRFPSPPASPEETEVAHCLGGAALQEIQMAGAAGRLLLLGKDGWCAGIPCNGALFSTMLRLAIAIAAAAARNQSSQSGNAPNARAHNPHTPNFCKLPSGIPRQVD